MNEAEEKILAHHERLYQQLFENMLDGLAYCRMIYDDHGAPADFVYLEVNNAFTTLTGLKEVTGKHAIELFPDLKESNSELLDTYGRVAETGKPERFEVYFKPLAQWFSICVYSPEKGFFIAVFDNITETKTTEQNLRKHNAELDNLNHILVDRELKMIELKQRIAELEKENDLSN